MQKSQRKQQRRNRRQQRRGRNQKPSASKYARKVGPEAMAKALERTFGRAEIESAARQAGFMKRKRKLIPQALVIALICTLGLGKVDWLADILRAYNELTKGTLRYKPFHNQLRKLGFERWMRAILEMALSKLVFQVIQPKPDSKLLRFRDINIHDGTSFALKAALKAQYPGRFKKVSPAAVELHVTMSLFEDAPNRITMTADKEAERHFRPDAEELRGSLLLGDRAFQHREYFGQLCDAEGSFIIRGTKNIRPIIVEARNRQGRRLRHLEGKQLKWRLLPRESVDLEIAWPRNVADKNPYCGRIVVLYTPGPRNTKEYTYLHTNLDRHEFAMDEVGDLYRLRWQIELMFKEWKSHANLHAFDTSKTPIAEGLIWASLLAATVKRAIAHATELAKGVELSTLRTARSATHYLPPILKSLFRSTVSALITAIIDAYCFLAANARRAHPQRDKEKGRFKPGLQAIGVS